MLEMLLVQGGKHQFPELQALVLTGRELAQTLPWGRRLELHLDAGSAVYCLYLDS